MIVIEVDNVNCQIKGLETLHIIDAISKALTYTVQSARYTWQFKTGNWDGTQRLLTRGLKFPTGCLDTVTAVLHSYNLQFEIKDKRVFSTPNHGGLEWNGFDLYDYQNEIVEAALDKKGGMIKAATGAGKSICLSRIAYEYNLPTVIYVVSLDLLSQMHNTLSKCLNVPIGVVGGGRCDIQNITVCSAWTAGKVYSSGNKKEEYEEDVVPDKWNPSDVQKQRIKEMIENARLVMLDEAQFAAASSIQVILKNSKSASHKYGLSASPWRSDGLDILLEAAFGSTICDIKASRLIKEGYLVPPKIFFKDIPPPPFYIDKKWATVKKEYLVENDIRNHILIESVKNLLDIGRKPLLLFREHRHGKILRDMLPDDIRYAYVTGKSSADERDQIRDDFSNGDLDLIIASTIYDQGVDLPGLDALVLAGGGKSTAKALQRVGRVIRGNKSGGKKDAYVVETWDQSHFVKSHSVMRYRIYNTEPEFKIKMGDAMKDYAKRYIR